MVYSAWYKFRNLFNDKIRLCAGETDSLKMQIFDESNSLYTKLKSVGDFLDFSSLPPNHELYDESNLCELGKWKVVSLNISEFISIKSKMFSYLIRCDKCKQNFTPDCDYCKYYKRQKVGASGVPTDEHKHLTHDFYSQLVECHGTFKNKQLLHNMSFNSLDTRRFFEGNPEESLAFGHYRIQ